MEQLELFGEDPRIYELPPEKRWAIYTNPTPYQQKLNDEYFKIHKLIKKNAIALNNGRSGHFQKK